MKDKRYNAYQYKIERDHERATFLRAKLENAEKHWRESRVAMIEAEHSEVRKLLKYHIFIFTFPMLFSVLLFMLMTFYLLRPFHCQHNVMPSLVTKLRFELMTQLSQCLILSTLCLPTLPAHEARVGHLAAGRGSGFQPRCER